jgi:hypothetical protein
MIIKKLKQEEYVKMKIKEYSYFDVMGLKIKLLRKQ